jgi:hypothetical protein
MQASSPETPLFGIDGGYKKSGDAPLKRQL